MDWRAFPEIFLLSNHSYLSFIGPVPVILLPSSEKVASPPVIVKEAFLSTPSPELSSNSRYLSVTRRRSSGFFNPSIVIVWVEFLDSVGIVDSISILGIGSVAPI